MNNFLKNEDIYILGVGHNTITCIDLAEDCNYNIKGLIHFDNSKNGEEYKGYDVIGSFDELLNIKFCKDKNFLLSMGNLSIKSELFDKIKKLGGKLPSLIHPTSYLSRHSEVEDGVQILQNSVIEGDVHICYDTTITVNTVIAHNVTIGSHNLISGNCIVGAYTTIGNFTHIGQGSTIVSGKVNSIGDRCILGAGAVLLNDMPSDTIYVGNPAHILKKINVN